MIMSVYGMTKMSRKKIDEQELPLLLDDEEVTINMKPKKLAKSKTTRNKTKKVFKSHADSPANSEDDSLTQPSHKRQNTLEIAPESQIYTTNDKYQNLEKSFFALNALLILAKGAQGETSESEFLEIINKLHESYVELSKDNKESNIFINLQALNSTLIIKDSYWALSLLEITNCDSPAGNSSLSKFMVLLYSLNPIFKETAIGTITKDQFLSNLLDFLIIASSKIVTDMYFVEDKNEKEKKVRDRICLKAGGLARKNIPDALRLADEIVSELKLLLIP